MRRHFLVLTALVLCLIAAAQLQPQVAPAPKKAAPAAAPAPKKAAPPAPTVLTNRDVIRLVQAKISEDLIVAKIEKTKTNFDTSVDGLVALKQAGVSDRLISIMMNPGAPATPPPPSRTEPLPPAPVEKPKPTAPPAQTAPQNVAATVTNVAARTPAAARPAVIAHAPDNYGVYIERGGELKPLGRIQTKVQISKFRSLMKSVVPFVRQKIDINIPGAHSTSRYEVLRPNFYAYFPPSRDVSKFKLLQCKITGQKFDQRTVANASIFFSTEQNQDEVACDIGPTSVKDLYRISPREDLPTGEFGFVEGNTGSKSTSNIEIIDVYDFGVDRKEEKLGLKDYLDLQPPAGITDTTFLTWTKEDAQKVVVDREGKTGITGGLMGWFKSQYATLDVYWADDKFARAFARLEMLDRSLTPDQAAKLCTLLRSDPNQYNIVVSVGGKIGSGKLIGANEGERLMRPFDASLANNRSKDIVPARKMEFIGGYAGMWKVEFNRDSIKGPLLTGDVLELVFEARLNQNLDFKAKFPMDKINATLEGAAPAGGRN